MVLLFVGDVVGAEATRQLADRLPELRYRHEADLVVVNAENCAPSGLGMTVELLDALFDGGADVITGGNHSWDGPEAEAALADPRVLRPLNVASGTPGRGTARTHAAAEPVTVVNLADRRALPPSVTAASPYAAWQSADREGVVIVDYHGDHVIEKQIFARAVDGEAACVLGTHSHEPTLPLYVLPGGTGFVADVGMTGPVDGVQGFAYAGFVAGLRLADDCFALPLPEPIGGPIALGAVRVEIVDGSARRIERLGWDGPVELPSLVGEREEVGQ